MKKYIFPLLIALSALSLAGAAAFFSVTGLSKLFGGAKTEVIIMASALEFAKLVTASFLHRYWKDLKWQMKTYLTTGVVTVMIITSLGIYGFLSNAYSVTSNKLQNVDSQVELVDKKKTIINSEISRLEENKKLKSNRVQSLVDLRTKQEARVDSLYNRHQSSSAKRVEAQIEQSTKEIANTTIEVDTLNAQIQRKYAEISTLDLEVIDLKNNDINSEVGPLRYIAKLTGKDMDSVVNFFILLLIFVFDPLAVSLVIATNLSIEKEFGRKKEEKKESEPVSDAANDTVNDTVNDATVDITSDVVNKNTIEEIVAPKQELEVNVNNKEEVMKYIADDSGEFKPVKEDVKIEIPKSSLEELKAQGIERNASYLSFLEVLFDGGKLQVGDDLLSYQRFLEELTKAGIAFKEKEVLDFLTICNLFKITHMSKETTQRRYLAKSYADAKTIISLLS